MKSVIFSFFIIIFYFDQAFAYIDPGTGGIIVQAIIGFIAAVSASAALYWRKLKELFSKIFKSKKKID